MARAMFWIAFVLLDLGVSAAHAEGNGNQEPNIAAMHGIQTRCGKIGHPNIVRITDGKTYLDVTEQEYRARGYQPDFDKLPRIIVKRVPVELYGRVYLDERALIEGSRPSAKDFECP